MQKLFENWRKHLHEEKKKFRYEPPAWIMPIAQKAAQEAGVPVNLILALMYKESRYDPTAVSGAGAKGLMQLMPITVKHIHLKRTKGKQKDRKALEPFAVLLDDKDWHTKNPGLSVRAGTWVLKQKMDRHRGNLHAALASYNNGEAGKDHPGAKAYARSVIAIYKKFNRRDQIRKAEQEKIRKSGGAPEPAQRRDPLGPDVVKRRAQEPEHRVHPRWPE